MNIEEPKLKPSNPCFSSGPCAKHPNYNIEINKLDSLGRSHRSTLCKSKIKQAMIMTKEILELPDEYKVGFIHGSDTGAFEAAMWSLLGPKEIDVLSWESFGSGWYDDISKHLKLKVRHFNADYGKLPDLKAVDNNHDIIFTWNGTTSGVCIPDGEWISDNREGLTLCDATSAVFSMDLPWNKLDVITFSPQKSLGSEAGFGIIILSPRAIQRLESYVPSWPIPKIFRLINYKTGKLNHELFEGSVINTISMLCIEDYLDALNWAKSVGGLKSLVNLTKNNFSVVNNFVNNYEWIDFLADNPLIRSTTSVCLKLNLSEQEIKNLTNILSQKEVAYDINSYPQAPSGIRIWCGPTVKKDDICLLLIWIKWAHNFIKSH